MPLRKSPFARPLAALAGFCLPFAAVAAPAPPAPNPPSYADLADLADSAPLVLRAEIRKVALVEPARAPGLRAGHARFYVEAKTQVLYFGRNTLGETLRYLVDVPLDARGKPPKLKKLSVLLFARAVPDRPGELQLIAPDSQLPWDAASEMRLHGVIVELTAPGAPGRVTAVREAIHVAGTLAGQSETQIFLATPGDAPAAITVLRQPGQAATWSVSFSEVVAGEAGVPLRDTLVWYRLACFLPGTLPPRANLSEGPDNKAMAERDYRLVMDQLGTCPRTRR